jgi:hypothetical protein
LHIDRDKLLKRLSQGGDHDDDDAVLDFILEGKQLDRNTDHTSQVTHARNLLNTEKIFR